ncbi:prolipoprotein diacylglyceryl transferase, partial [candidate division KSB1 bacterium]
MAFVAIFVAFYIAYHGAKKQKLNIDMFFRSALWMGAGALIGGRIAYFLTPGPAFLNIYLHGFHSWGVILGGFFGLVIYCWHNIKIIKKKHKSLYVMVAELLDVYVLGAAIMIFFYRIGCFLTHCIEIGAETNVFWAVLDNGVMRHPVTLYYSLAGLVMFVVLVELNKRKMFDGYVACWFAVLYFGERFLLDFLRVYPSRHLGMATTQIIYLVLFVLVGLMLFFVMRMLR